MSRRAFTLIELLVVIAIIAILAAILFPVFAQAKAAAKKSSDLSNMKQIGLGIMMYVGDHDDTYPQAYWYKNDLGDLGGYVQFSGSTMPYVKNADLWVSPMNPQNALVPTNPPCADISETDVNAVPCDSQVPKISYTANAALMPRKRRSIDPANVVATTMVDEPSATILVAPFSETAACVNDTSNQQSVGFKNKSHRSTNAYMLDAAGTKWKGEAAAEFGLPGVYAATMAIVNPQFELCRTTPGPNYLQLVYIDPDRFGNGSNYAMADGSAKFQPFSRTINPNRFMWGTKVYSGGNMPVLDQNGDQVK